MTQENTAILGREMSGIQHNKYSATIDYSRMGLSPLYGDWIAVFDIFLDESGTHGQDLIVIAGFVAKGDQWAQFSLEWKNRLGEISHFHTKDFRNPQSKIYSALGDQGKRALLDDLIAIIQRNLLFGVINISCPRIFNEVTTPAFRREVGTIYSVIGQQCVAIAMRALSDLGINNGTLGFVIEEGHKNRQQLLDGIEATKKETNPIEVPSDVDQVMHGGPSGSFRNIMNGQIDPLRREGIKIGAYGKGSKKQIAALQAADLLAYCIHDDASRPAARFGRPILNKLLEGIPLHARMVGREQIEVLIAASRDYMMALDEQRQKAHQFKKELRALALALPLAERAREDL